MDTRHTPYAERNLPRYTSYPTAPHFNAEVTGAVYAKWLRDIAEAGAPLSLYIHVPFCREICWYCGCNTKAARRREPVRDYVSALRAEIALASSILGAAPVGRIHWGGGTPNILAAEDMDEVFTTLAETFDLGPLTEHAIEIDPRTLTDAHVESFRRHGVTRASLGVQDFNAHVQAAIGRIQPADVAARCVDMLRGAGVRGVSFDLMYGLPLQSVADAANSARIAADMSPDRLSVFGYAHVPWFKARQRLIDAETLPGLHARHAQVEAVAEVLRDAGYVEIGLDHYARADDPLACTAATGQLRRNFQGYVDDASIALVGFGPSAISSLPQGYAQNSPEVGRWAASIHAGELPIVRGYALQPDDRARRAIIERILCDFRVDLAQFGGTAAFADAIAILREAETDELVRIEGDVITIPQEARRLARVVASAFDAFHHDRPARHSRAL